MRALACVIAIAATTVVWHLSGIAGEVRCSYVAKFPPATGQHAFLLATATAETVTAPLDSSYVHRQDTVPGQLMAIDDIAGYQAEAVRDGLHESGDTAVFVRYRIGLGCNPIPALDGAPDSAGVNGLYVGRPRPADDWIDGRPTFDVFMAPHFPLPQRLSGPSGHLVITVVDTTPTMTATELFTMYQALWAESVSIRDASVERRIRRWLETSPQTARKQPAKQVAMDMLSSVTDALIDASPVPFGGTFEITVVVPGADSVVMYGQTSHKARPWVTDVVRDSITSVPVAVHPRSFALDVTTAASVDGSDRSSIQINPCPPIPIVVDELPIIPDIDSTWYGEIWLTGFLECEPASDLARLIRSEVMHALASGPTSVVFRRHPDGRVTFESPANGDGAPGMLVRGKRLSTTTYGQPFD